jgi:hypothetical protein
MISLKRLIVEGRYDSLVTKLSNKLLGIVKDSYSSTQTKDGKFAGKKIYYTKDEEAPHIEGADDNGIDLQPEIYFEEVEAADIPLEFYLTLKVQWIDGFNDYRIGGDAYNETSRYAHNAADPPLIEIRFRIDPTEYPKVLSEIAMDLRDVLRHEIEHITQSGWNVKSGKYLQGDQARRSKIQNGELPTFNYWLLPKEQTAMLQGLYTRAKKERRPFADVVNDNLDIWVTNGTITDEQKQTILNSWRKLLPSLGIKQEL